MPESAEKIRVLVVDDSAVMREGIGAIIGAQPDMIVVGEAGNGEEAVHEFKRLLPNVTIADVNLPTISGIQAMSLIREEAPDARFIVISVFNEDERIRQSFSAGAQAFLHKDMLRRELIRVIRAVHEGQQYFPPGFSAE